MTVPEPTELMPTKKPANSPIRLTQIQEYWRRFKTEPVPTILMLFCTAVKRRS